MSEYRAVVATVVDGVVAAPAVGASLLGYRGNHPGMNFVAGAVVGAAAAVVDVVVAAAI